MATVSYALESLPTVLGVAHVTLQRYLRALREDGLIRTGRRGGGRGAVHLDNLTLARIVLGLAAAQPSEAPTAVRALQGLKVSAADQTQSLVEMLAEWISLCGTERLSLGQLTPGLHKNLETWELQMSVAPAWARLSYEGIRSRSAFTFEGADPLSQGLRRITILTGDALQALGTLWADSKIQQDALDKIAALQTPLLSNATPEKDEADCLCQEEQSALSVSQPSANPANGFRDRRQNACVEREFQGHRSRSVGHSLFVATGVHHEPGSTHA